MYVCVQVFLYVCMAKFSLFPSLVQTMLYRIKAVYMYTVYVCVHCMCVCVCV